MGLYLRQNSFYMGDENYCKNPHCWLPSRTLTENFEFPPMMTMVSTRHLFRSMHEYYMSVHLWSSKGLQSQYQSHSWSGKSTKPLRIFPSFPCNADKTNCFGGAFSMGKIFLSTTLLKFHRAISTKSWILKMFTTVSGTKIVMAAQDYKNKAQGCDTRLWARNNIVKIRMRFSVETVFYTQNLVSSCIADWWD